MSLDGNVPFYPDTNDLLADGFPGPVTLVPVVDESHNQTPADYDHTRLRQIFAGMGQPLMALVQTPVRHTSAAIDDSISPDLPPVLFLELSTFTSIIGRVRQARDILRLESKIDRMESKIDRLLRNASPSSTEDAQHDPDDPDLNDIEKDILAALGEQNLIGADIAKGAERNFDSRFKDALATLVRRKILGKKSRGYYRL